MQLFFSSSRKGVGGGLEAALFLQAYYYNFSKNTASTKIPDIDPASSGEVALKSPSGRGSLAIDTANVPRNVNYCYIDTINRYYYVTDVEYLSNGLTRLHLKVDVLASFRNSISNVTAYVRRAASAGNNDIIDSFYPARSGSTQLENSAQFIPLANTGFIVAIIGNREDAISNTSGAARYYLLSDTALANLMKWIFTESNYETEITDQVVKTFFNPSQYILSCMYCPFASGSTGSTIQLGWWDTGISALELSPQMPIEIDSVTINIPRHYPANDYKNYEPYTTYRIYIPFVGMQTISASLLKEASSITVSGVVDICTGTLMVKLVANTGALIGYYEGKGCVELPLAQSTLQTNLISAIGGGMELIADQTGLSSTAFGEAVADIGNGLVQSQKQYSQVGNAGNGAQRIFESQVRLFADCKEIVDTNNNDFGSPLCEVRRIGSLSGFVQCQNAHFENSVASLNEIDEIENYLNGGFYYE